MKYEEEFGFGCKCEDIKKIVIAMCDLNPQRDGIVQGSLPCLTLRALMHENFPEFGSAVSANDTYCECPECKTVLCSCNWGFEEEDIRNRYAVPSKFDMDRFPVKKDE